LGGAGSGKSTLINALNGAFEGTGGERIAFTSKDKGKTFQLNFYLARHRHNSKV
jgi:GTP-binding protein EngB required for normal cell division